jgi:hypothetical protein
VVWLLRRVCLLRRAPRSQEPVPVPVPVLEPVLVLVLVLVLVVRR